jgi:superkiller protein 3
MTASGQRLVFAGLAVSLCATVLASYAIKVRAVTATSSAASERDAHLRRGLELQRRGSLDEAFQEYTAAAARDPQSAIAFYNIGTVYYERRNFAAAADAYVRAVTIDTGFADAQFNLGYTRLHHLNDAAGAIEPLRAAIEANARMAKAYFELGNAYFETGAPDRAEPMWQTAVALDPRLRDVLPARKR